MAINYTAPNGWRKWTLLRSSYSGVQFVDAPFSPFYAPADGIWVKSYIDTCSIPWSVGTDAFTDFLAAGGSTSLIGAVTGIGAAQQSLSQPSTGTFGLGFQRPPSAGFCVGDKFKQHIYIRFDVLNTPPEVILTNYNIQLLQNYRFKQIYAERGTILAASNVRSQYTLDLGIATDIADSSQLGMSGETITIIPSNVSSASYTMNITKIKNNWDIVVTPPTGKYPTPGDYYKLSKMWCLEDPYLLSGFWNGLENDIDANPASGKNLYKTSHISPYVTSKFTGIYIWGNTPDSSTTTTTTVIASGTTSSTTTPLPIIQPAVGASMANSSGKEWYFLGLSNKSDVYPSTPTIANPDIINTRYNVVFTDAGATTTTTTLAGGASSTSTSVVVATPSPDGYTVTYLKRQKATDADYDKLKTAIKDNNPAVTYLRVEINGGYVTRHNFYAPCLEGSFITQKISGVEKYFKILAQVDANTIDVAVKSIDGKTTFDPKSNQDYSIVNQYGWFINEHYDSQSQSQPRRSMFQGIIKSIVASSGTVVINIDKGDSSVSQYSKNVPGPNDKSFAKRYKQTASTPSTMVKRYKKYRGWNLVCNKKEYFINDITGFSTSPDTAFIPYEITVKINSISEDEIKIGDSVYVAFGPTFESFNNYSKSNGGFFLVDRFFSSSSTTCCLYGEYNSIPYRFDVSSNDRVGFTEGYKFGLDVNGSSQSIYNQFMLVTTPSRGRGIASLFHVLRQEDWVVYQDPSTKNITIRKGCLDFKEYPVKTEVAIGKPTDAKSASGTTEIILDKTKERLRRLCFILPESAAGAKPALLFGIGSASNIYGFLVSGDGLVDLQMLEIQGIKEGEQSSDTYLDSSGRPVSPVYIYKHGSLGAAIDNYVDMGVDTSEKIHVINGGISSVEAQYINKNQIMGGDNLFDIIQLPDGELLMLYGQRASSFNIDGVVGETSSSVKKLNNSSSNKTKWFSSSAVYAIGSRNDAYFWGTPIKLKFKDVEEKEFQYPIMLINSVNYLASIYNPLSDTLSIFVMAYDSSYSYIGCFKTAMGAMLHKLYNATPQDYDENNTSEFPLKFFYRPPIMKDTFVADVDKSWIRSKNDIIEDDFTLSDTDKPKFTEDEYVRVLGSSGANCQVKTSGDFGIISTSILVDGTYALWYNSDAGIKVIFSVNQGATWVSSNLIWARDGRCPVLVGTTLLYISEDGIRAKLLSDGDLSDGKTISLAISEGKSISSEEESKQAYLDGISSVLIGSGKMEYQRLSGYVSPTGIVKVFCYDSNNRLKCMETYDGTTWSIADNF